MSGAWDQSTSGSRFLLRTEEVRVPKAEAVSDEMRNLALKENIQ
jgi:hypothetical protein